MRPIFERTSDSKPRQIFERTSDETDEEPSVSQDIINLPSNLWQLGKNIIKDAPEELEGAYHMPLGRSLKNLAAGPLSLFNIPHQAAEYYQSRHIPYLEKLAEHYPWKADLDPNKYLGLGERQPGDIAWQLGAPGGLLKNTAKGLGNAALKEVKKVGEKAAEKMPTLSVWDKFRSELSPEELAHNLNISEGTETPLGNIIESPWLQRLHENVLPHIIGSGAEKTMLKNASNITEKGEGILSKSREGQPVSENYGHEIKKALQESAQKVEKEKTAKFNKVNELAEKSGITTSRTNLRDTAASILKQIKSDPDLAQFTNPGDIKLIEEIINPNRSKAEPSFSTRQYEQTREEPNYKGKINLATGEPLETINTKSLKTVRTPSPTSVGNYSVITGKKIQEPHNYSLRNTDILRGKIGENAYEASVKGEKPKAAIYQRLKEALEKDINESVEHSSNQELKNARKEAMEFYEKDYAPFKDKDILKFIKEGGDPDIIVNHFLKTGANDRATLLRKLSLKTKTPTNLLAHAYLSPAYKNGQLDPIKLSTLYHKLGNNQRLELFGENLNKELKEYTDLVHKNKESFHLMFNPKTGARLGHIGTLTGLIGSGGSALPSIIGTGVAGKIANKVLTHPKYREKIVNAIIKKNQKR